MNIDLTGRAAVVTGAAQGIGEFTARRLAASGASVLIADIQEKGESVARSICERGGRAAFIRADVGREDEIQRMIARCVDAFDRLDILVNNAHWEVVGSAAEITAEDWDKSFAVLLRALFLGAKYAVPHMIAAGGGSIINISSILGKRAVPRYVTYTTAKSAVAQLSRQLAVDYGPKGIRVNTITPGTIRTGKAMRENERDRESTVAQITPLRVSGIPEDIANAICFLVSDQAAFITGADLVVDGGLGLLFAGSVQQRLDELSR